MDNLWPIGVSIKATFILDTIVTKEASGHVGHLGQRVDSWSPGVESPWPVTGLTLHISESGYFSGVLGATGRPKVRRVTGHARPVGLVVLDHERGHGFGMAGTLPLFELGRVTGSARRCAQKRTVR